MRTKTIVLIMGICMFVLACRNSLIERSGKMIEPLTKPDMSDFDNRPSGDYVDVSPNTYQEQYDRRTLQDMRNKINKIIECLNEREKDSR